MATISKEQYPAMKAFFAAWWARFPLPGVGPEHSPLLALDAAEKKSPTMARRGLGLAIGDIVEMSWDLKAEEVARIDADFADQGGFSLSRVRALYSTKVWKIVKRGKIRNDDEWYLLRSVSDFPQVFPDGVTIGRVQSILDQYGTV